ncbi:hypothetical protein [Natronorubrum aibiense]|uniref:hypothetical protein n=1 Tax=Natronorubrum aibiense TaxID=348826 RepID=UPI0029C9C85F|nr:hypothetical protein [Natronorubrum aibiense]
MRNDWTTPISEPSSSPRRQRHSAALHEAIGHLYDELAIARQRSEAGSDFSDDLFDDLETLYVVTAEASATELELTYRLEDGDET